jgi:hypothetical protein
VKIAVKLFKGISITEESKKYTAEFTKLDGCGKLFFWLNTSTNMKRKEQILIILGLFINGSTLSGCNKIIVEILKEVQSSPAPDTNHLYNIIYTLISISFSSSENQMLFIDSGIITVLFPLMDYEIVWRNTIILLHNICLVNTNLKKNEIIKTSIFNIFYRRLLEISPPPFVIILPDNFYSLSLICSAICNLVLKNSEGVDVFVCSPLVHLLVTILEIITSIAINHHALKIL